MENHMENRINDIFREVLEWDDEKEVVDEMNSDNVEDWDSLVSMSLVLQLEKEFQIKFRYDEVLEMESVGDIKRIVAEKLK